MLVVVAHPALDEHALEKAEMQPCRASLAEYIPSLLLPCLLIHLYLQAGKWHLVLLVTTGALLLSQVLGCSGQPRASNSKSFIG